MQSYRPTIRGRSHMASACHYLAATAAFKVLESGGNAVDAGVAGGIALSVVEPEYVSFGGVAPIIIYLAEERQVITVSGLGTWPKAVSREYFQDKFGMVPEGILRTVVPAAADGWMTALKKWGTMSFAEVAEPALDFAKNGFPVDVTLASKLKAHAPQISRYPSSMAVLFPKGRPPRVGELFVQKDLANTFQYLVDEEKAAAGRGREAAIEAARAAFYTGDIAKKIVAFQKENGGILTEDDLARYRSGVESPYMTTFAGSEIYTCGPWCQGPSLLQMLNLLDADQLMKFGHNSTRYIHQLTEAIKLAFADREAYYGDPRLIEVPMEALLSSAYSQTRKQMIRSDTAWPEMPPAGTFEELGIAPRPERALQAAGSWRDPELDTSYVCTVDRHGNAFSATPSDGTTNHAPIVPGLGFTPSPRGCQNWVEPNHASSVAPGKRPRLTPNPAMAVRDNGFVMPFGTPGGDVQTQAMLQMLLNIELFDMPLQAAIEAPRFASYSFPSSFEPHDYHPGLLRLEGRISKETGDELAALGHRVEYWGDWTGEAGTMCAINANPQIGLIEGGADPRRNAYAMGR